MNVQLQANNLMTHEYQMSRFKGPCDSTRKDEHDLNGLFISYNTVTHYCSKLSVIRVLLFEGLKSLFYMETAHASLTLHRTPVNTNTLHVTELLRLNYHVMFTFDTTTHHTL